VIIQFGSATDHRSRKPDWKTRTKINEADAFQWMWKKSESGEGYGGGRCDCQTSNAAFPRIAHVSLVASPSFSDNAHVCMKPSKVKETFLDKNVRFIVYATSVGAEYANVSARKWSGRAHRCRVKSSMQLLCIAFYFSPSWLCCFLGSMTSTPCAFVSSYSLTNGFFLFLNDAFILTSHVRLSN